MPSYIVFGESFYSMSAEGVFILAEDFFTIAKIAKAKFLFLWFGRFDKDSLLVVTLSGRYSYS